ncbi:MAG TPA: hypothetical protein VMU84_20545, partial [Thermoanaerobaculia bacterium]|nr:hypothetical protein [Thermoanaerobaculia bacterium]
IGLSVLHTASAYGSVNIVNASTYGLAITELNPQIDQWAVKNRQFLRQYGPRAVQDKKGKPKTESSYVRIVYRVFVAGGVNVSLVSDESTGARGDAGASKATTLFDAGDSTTAVNAANNYKQVLSALNTSIASTALGANVQIASASSRSVAMDETFPRPLVIGYLAFDRQITDGGFLGPPIPTQARVSGKPYFEATTSFAKDDETRRRVGKWLASNPAVNSEKLKTWLTQNGYDATKAPLYAVGDQYTDVRTAMIEALGIP